MCGRYSLTIQKAPVVRRFKVSGATPDLVPRFNIAPTQTAPLVVPASGSRRMVFGRWGMPAPWATVGRGLINARAETLADKAFFRRLLNRGRCAVPADGFYEWQAVEGRKQPWHISRTDREPFAFAGLWDDSADHGPVFLILTTRPNSVVAPIHSRMPVILRADLESGWLDPDRPFDSLDPAWSVPSPAEDLSARRVGPAVNSVRNDSAACLADPPPPQPFLL